MIFFTLIVHADPIFQLVEMFLDSKRLQRVRQQILQVKNWDWFLKKIIWTRQHIVKIEFLFRPCWVTFWPILERFHTKFMQPKFATGWTTIKVQISKSGSKFVPCYVQLILWYTCITIGYISPTMIKIPIFLKKQVPVLQWKI